MTHQTVFHSAAFQPLRTAYKDLLAAGLWSHHNPLMLAAASLSFAAAPFSSPQPEWQNTCERWHQMCSTLKTTEPREPNNKAHDSAQACPHCCEVSITGGLGSRLLPVSLTARGVTGAGEAWRTSTPIRVEGKHSAPGTGCTPLGNKILYSCGELKF